MKLICISEKTYPHLTNESHKLFNKTWRYLTIGKEYESISHHFLPNIIDGEYLSVEHLEIIDDSNTMGYYPLSNFITQSQIREEKFNKILNENI